MFPTEKDFELARILVDHSVKVKAQEKVLIATDDLALPLAKAVYEEVVKRGAYPMMDISTNGTNFIFYKHADDWQLGYVPDAVIKAKYDWADCFIRIFADDNLRELAQIAPKKLTDRAKLMRPYSEIMLKKRWVLTDYPTGAMAQEAGVSLWEMREIFYSACIVDYKKMGKDLSKLEKIMDEGKMVHVIGKQTDLWVNIEGRLAQKCAGECNVPDGESFLAPITDGVEGEVYFELPTLAYGHLVSGIHLEFKKGKVINAKADVGDDALQQMLNTDDGARTLGEFAIGANFNIKRGMMNTLFDEKIGGTIHMALGMAYKSKRGGGENDSGIHWDLVKDMRLPGSVLTIDEVVVLKEGKLLI